MLLKAIQYFIMLTALFGGLLFTHKPILKVTEELNCIAVCVLRDIPPFLCTSMHPFLTAGTKAETAVHSPRLCNMCGVPFLSPTACLVLVLAISESGSFEKCFKIINKKEEAETLEKELAGIPMFSPENLLGLFCP